MFAWLVAVLSGGCLGVLLSCLYFRKEKEALASSVRIGGGIAAPPSPTGTAVPSVQMGSDTFEGPPLPVGSINCGCLPEAVMPTVYEDVAVVRIFDIGGRAYPQIIRGLRCAGCGKVCLWEDFEARAAEALKRPK